MTSRTNAPETTLKVGTLSVSNPPGSQIDLPSMTTSMTEVADRLDGQDDADVSRQLATWAEHWHGCDFQNGSQSDSSVGNHRQGNRRRREALSSLLDGHRITYSRRVRSPPDRLRPAGSAQSRIVWRYLPAKRPSPSRELS